MFLGDTKGERKIIKSIFSKTIRSDFYLKKYILCLSMGQLSKKLQKIFCQKIGKHSRVKKGVSERVSPRVMHRIQSETLGKTLAENFRTKESRQESSQESRIGSYA